MAKHSQAKFRALSNMGDILTKMNNIEEAVKVYHKQLTLSKQIQDKILEASAFGSLGVCHRLLKRFDKSLGFHTQVGRYDDSIDACKHGSTETCAKLFAIISAGHSTGRFFSC